MVESGERSEGGINKGEERERVRGVSLSPPTQPPHCFFLLLTSHDLIVWNTRKKAVWETDNEGLLKLQLSIKNCVETMVERSCTFIRWLLIRFQVLLPKCLVYGCTTKEEVEVTSLTPYLIHPPGGALLYKPYAVEHRFNEPLYNEVLSITNDFLQPGQRYNKMDGTEPRFNGILIITNTIHKSKRKICLDITNKCHHVIKDKCQTDQQG